MNQTPDQYDGSCAPRIAFDVEELIITALKRAGRTEFADTSFYDPLRRLLAASDAEAALNTLGRYAVRFEIQRSLRNLLAFERREQNTPSILSRSIERPLFITGMPRSGSTFLHRLLVQDPALTAPRSWQLVYPHLSPSGWLESGVRRAWVQAQFYLMRLLAPELDRLHHIAANEPEECTDITAQVFQSLRYDSVYRVPSYQDWLQGHGHQQAFRFHRRFLQHLDAHAPARRWVLKSPDHVFALDDIQAVYPDARWVFIHRDPVAVLASVATLTEVLRRPFTQRVDRLEIGRQVFASWREGARRMLRAAAASDAMLHLQYHEVLADPLRAVQRIYRHCGLTVSALATQRMRNWLENRRNRNHRPRPYVLSTFGLDPYELREEFAPYTSYFDLKLEWCAVRHASHARR